MPLLVGPPPAVGGGGPLPAFGGGPRDFGGGAPPTNPLLFAVPESPVGLVPSSGAGREKALNYESNFLCCSYQTSWETKFL